MASEEAESSFRTQIKVLEDELVKEKAKLAETKARYRREHEMMFSALHGLGMRSMRHQLTAPPKIEKTSFLGIHRSSVSP